MVIKALIEEVTKTSKAFVKHADTRNTKETDIVFFLQINDTSCSSVFFTLAKFAKDIDNIIQNVTKMKKKRIRKRFRLTSSRMGYTRRSARSSKDAWLPRCMSSNVMKEKEKVPSPQTRRRWTPLREEPGRKFLMEMSRTSIKPQTFFQEVQELHLQKQAARSW